MLKQLLQAIIDRIKPCEHEWELIDEQDVFGFEYLEKIWTYRCKKCCKTKVIDNK